VFLQRAAGEICPVEPQEVEGEELDRHLFSHLLDVLEWGQVYAAGEELGGGVAGLVRGDDLSVDDGGGGVQELGEGPSSGYWALWSRPVAETSRVAFGLT
jgi:hypothetical protein